jgi:hypothetical protein
VPIDEAQILQIENILPVCTEGIETHTELDIPCITNSSIDNNSEYTFEAILAKIIATLVDDNDSQYCHKGMSPLDADECKKAISLEWNSILENEMFSINTQEAYSYHAPLSYKSVFKKNKNHNKTIHYKVRL